MKHYRIPIVLLLLIIVPVLSGCLTRTGTVTGLVKDQDGTLLSGVQIEISGRTGGTTSGSYTISGLPMGAHNVVATYEGETKSLPIEVKESWNRVDDIIFDLSGDVDTDEGQEDGV